MRTQFTGMPVRRAASGLPPTAKIQRPHTIRLVKTTTTNGEAHDEDRRHRDPADRAAAEDVDDLGHAADGRPSASHSASPRAMLSVASVTMNGWGIRPQT